MHVDLSFQSSAAEQEFRRHRLQLLPRQAYPQMEILRLVSFTLIVYRVGAAGGLLGSLASTVLFLVQPSASLRLRYAASALCEILFVVAGINITPHMGWASPQGGSTFRALAETASMHGCPVWLSITVFVSPLPFRLLFPVLACQSGLLILCTPRMCRSAGLQQGYGLAQRALERLVSPAAAQAGGGATAGRSSAHQLCAAAYQPSVVVLGGLLVGYLAYSSELEQRRRFVLRCRSADRQRLLLRASGLPARPHDFWLFFGLPLACMLAWLHLSVLNLHRGV